MAAMSRTASVLTLVLLLTVQQGSSNKSCVMWSQAKPPVKRGSSLSVFCSFHKLCNQPCPIKNDHPAHLQTHVPVNATTLSINLINVTETTTFTCRCLFPVKFECGLDLHTGYPPDPPKNMLCYYISANTTSKEVRCSWDGGRKTYIPTPSVLWVKPGNDTIEPHPGSCTTGCSAKFFLNDTEAFSVTVRARNSLGAETVVWNFTLSDIVKPPPPALSQPRCSSRACSIHVLQSEETLHQEVQHRTAADHQRWKSSVQNNSTFWVSSLQPNTVYGFRARSKLSTGLWSKWSATVSIYTQEEAPAEQLDVWWTELSSESLQVYWKEMNSSAARGRIQKYVIKVEQSNQVKETSANERNTSVRACARCQVSVSACNSRGCSPPAKISRHKRGPNLEVNVETHNNSLCLSWTASDPGAAESVVEWYREGLRLEQVQWVRLSRAQHQTVITEVEPAECYEGAVHVFYGGSVKKGGFRAAISETAPTVGPSVHDNNEGSKVSVTWTELPRGERGGCILRYKVHVENSTGHLWNYSIAFDSASKTSFTRPDVPPDLYSLWMTAWTAQGEGPAGRKIKFIISENNKLSIGLLCGLLFVLGLVLLWLCQCSTLKQRLRTVVKHFFEVVPDPANSKWAKGSMDFQIHQSEATVDEEQPVLTVVEELPQKTSKLSGASKDAVGSKPAPLHYPPITHQMSYSQDSESCGHTESSQDTTEVYIFSQCPGYQGGEEEEEEEEDMWCSSSNSFMDAREFKGNLTLDAVKINCTEVFQNMQR